MITVQQAVSATLDYVKQFGDVLPTSGVRLEEFDLDDSRQIWRITLSFAEPQQNYSGLMPATRHYKTFSVDANVGNVVAMKIRNPLSANS